ncbi:hypothetical protein M9458_048057, partial [Cirrhinus mrigala]
MRVHRCTPVMTHTAVLSLSQSLRSKPLPSFYANTGNGSKPTSLFTPMLRCCSIRIPTSMPLYQTSTV